MFFHTFLFFSCFSCFKRPFLTLRAQFQKSGNLVYRFILAAKNVKKCDQTPFSWPLLTHFANFQDFMFFMKMHFPQHFVIQKLLFLQFIHCFLSKRSPVHPEMGFALLESNRSALEMDPYTTTHFTDTNLMLLSGYFPDPQNVPLLQQPKVRFDHVGANSRSASNSSVSTFFQVLETPLYRLEIANYHSFSRNVNLLNPFISQLNTIKLTKNLHFGTHCLTYFSV